MAFIDLKIYSESLGMETDVFVVIPQRSTRGQIGMNNKAQDVKKYKCLYLLHGLTDDQTIWMRRTSIERYASNYGICVVMPYGARSFYSDMKYGGGYYTYITKELPAIIEDLFSVSPEREDRYIGGLSMGGYGALKAAFTDSGRYTAAFALSPVTDIHNSHFTNTLVPVFGEKIPESADLYHLSSAHNNDAAKLRLYVTIGTSDYMYEDAVRFNKHMQDLDYDYTYEETEGAHGWDVWDRTVQAALTWMLNK